MAKEITFTINDDGSTNLAVDPMISIAELGAAIVILGRVANKRLDEQAASIESRPALIRAQGIPQDIRDTILKD